MGEAAEATRALERAVFEAVRARLPFMEMIARRDYIVHVLDAEGRRDEHMAALGGCISRMVMPSASYTPLLGSGIDAVQAVKAFEAQ